MINMFLSNNPSSGDMDSSNLSSLTFSFVFELMFYFPVNGFPVTSRIIYGLTQ